MVTNWRFLLYECIQAKELTSALMIETANLMKKDNPGSFLKKLKQKFRYSDRQQLSRLLGPRKVSCKIILDIHLGPGVIAPITLPVSTLLGVEYY